jgi:predicted nucleic acid-binding protein
MKRTVLADTGPLYAAADPHDMYHSRARRELKTLERDKWEVLLAYPTLAEAYTLVLHRLGKKTASHWLEEILSGVSLVNPIPPDYHEALRRLQSFADQPITLFDATVAVLGLRLGVGIWTYDHHFELMGSAVWR